jgi:AraC-like DNA-binding protein
MVCDRCNMLVKSELEKLGLQLLSVELGEVETLHPISESKKTEIAKQLSTFGFELIGTKKDRTITKIKTVIIDLVHYKNEVLKVKMSEYLADHLHQDYASLSHLFSEEEGTTIEKFFILQKIERVKELLMYDELNLNEIAAKMNYSSVAYLSNQFKKTTGSTPSQFKQLKSKHRKQLDDL